MEEEEITKEKFMNDSLEPISIEQTEKILYQMKNCICKIYIKGNTGTGFFIKIPYKYKTNLLTVLITNNHVLNENELREQKALILYTNNTECKHIKIDNNRKLYSNELLDVTIIEIKEDDNINDFLELEDEIINNIDLNNEDIINYFIQVYINKSIYLLNYLKGETIHVSYGLISDINDNEIKHNCNTKEGSSGSPIISTKNNKVIGYHFGSSKQYEFNVGKLIINSIIEFNKKYNYLFTKENIIVKNKVLNNFLLSNDNPQNNYKNISKENINDLIPFRPELQNITSQKILLLSSSFKYKNCVRTVYFLKELNENKLIKKLSITEMEIKDKKFMIIYRGYQNEKICLKSIMENNGVIKTSIFDNANLIWKSLHKDEIISFVKKLNKYQRYNHFPKLGEIIGKKFNLFKKFITLSKKYPNDYNFMSKYYELIEFSHLFLNNINFNDKTNLWIVENKSSKNKNMRLLNDIKLVKQEDAISHFIYPHLINGKKYEIRLYFLITGFCPLKIYLFNNGFVKFPQKIFDLDFLINNPLEFEKIYSIDENTDEKWSLDDLRKIFIKNNINFNKIWEEIKSIIIKVVMSTTDIEIPLIKELKLSSSNLFEVFGIDFSIDENLKPWLIKIANNPSLDCNNQIEKKIKSNLLADIFNIIGIIPFSHDNKFELLDKSISYKDPIKEAIIETLCEFERPTGGFERIFPLKENIEYFSKFIANPEKENLLIWKKLSQNFYKKGDEINISLENENSNLEEEEEDEE